MLTLGRATLQGRAPRAKRASIPLCTRQLAVLYHSGKPLLTSGKATSGPKMESQETLADGSPASVTIFTTPGCPYCRRAKQALRESSVPYVEVDVSSDSELRGKLKEVTGQRTVPQIFLHGSWLGGSDALAAKMAEGSFLQELQNPTSSSCHLPEPLAAAVAQAQEAASSSSAAPAATPSTLTSSSSSSFPNLDALPTSTHSVPSCSQPQTKTFSGTALVDFLLQSRSSSGGSSSDAVAAAAAAAAGGSSSSSSSREEAAQLGQQLLDAAVITVVSDAPPGPELLRFRDSTEAFYRKRSDAPKSVAFGQALNTHLWWGSAPARSAEVVAEDLRKRILGLYDDYLSADGKTVRYKAMAQDPRFWEYVDATAELQKVDLAPLSREGLIAFGINLYNALVIHALVVHGVKHMGSPTGRLQFFQKGTRYNIGGYDYVCDDLENGILRGNRPAASAIGMLLGFPQWSKGPFTAEDPRGKKVVNPMDPRVHFALVCGAKSCPPIKLYSASNLEEGLSGAAEAFCASEVLIDKQSRTVSLSKIFKWYYPDFGGSKAERLAFLLPYLEGEKQQVLQQWLKEDPQASGVKVEYLEYNWEVNAAKE